MLKLLHFHRTFIIALNQSLIRTSKVSADLCTCTPRRLTSVTAAGTSSQNTQTQQHLQLSKKTLSSSSSINIILVPVSLLIGYCIGRWSSAQEAESTQSFILPNQPPRALPSGTPRGCCCEASSPTDNAKQEQEEREKNQRAILDSLIQIVGAENVISGLQVNSSNTLYLKGPRPLLGTNNCTALAIVTPTSLEQAVQSLQAIVDADCICIPQGANTGLTGGSTPRSGEENQDPHHRPRPTIILNMRKLNTMFPIDHGKRVVCLAGAGIATLSQNLQDWGFDDRESHSTLGSTFLNPTTAAGVAYGSGGTQLRKGPVYTDRALYVRIKGKNKWDENILEIVNTLDIDGLRDEDFLPTHWSTPLKQLDLYTRDVMNGYRRKMSWTTSSNNVAEGGKGKQEDNSNKTRMASDQDYAHRVSLSDKATVNRWNADTRGEDCNRSEGKVLILATVHDTFPKPLSTQTFWIAFSDLDTALNFRRQVCLHNPQDLPISVEYMDRDTFDVVDSAGRVLATLIKLFGAGDIIRILWKTKSKMEAKSWQDADLICDKILYKVNSWLPPVLPPPLMALGKSKDHHVAITVGEFGDGELNRFMERLKQFHDSHSKSMEIYPCLANECRSVTAFRFACAPAFRTWCVGNNVQGISVDYALPNNGGHKPSLQDEDNQPLKRLRYSHFGCNVVHEDLAYSLGVDTHSAKMRLKKLVEDQCLGKLPAEHGHGIEYQAPKDTQERWMKMDPLNVMNPGIGGLSMNYKYQR